MSQKLNGMVARGLREAGAALREQGGAEVSCTTCGHSVRTFNSVNLLGGDEEGTKD